MSEQTRSTEGLYPTQRRIRRPLVNPDNGKSWDHPDNAGLMPDPNSATVKGQGAIVVDPDRAEKTLEKIRKQRELAERASTQREKDAALERIDMLRKELDEAEEAIKAAPELLDEAAPPEDSPSNAPEDGGTVDETPDEPKAQDGATSAQGAPESKEQDGNVDESPEEEETFEATDTTAPTFERETLEKKKKPELVDLCVAASDGGSKKDFRGLKKAELIDYLIEDDGRENQTTDEPAPEVGKEPVPES